MKKLSLSHRDISVISDKRTISIGNDRFKRTFDLEQGIPRTVSFYSADTKNEIASHRSDGDFSVIGFNMPWFTDRKTNCVIDSMHAVACKAADGRPGVKVLLHITESVQQLRMIRTYFIYSDQPWMTAQLSVRAEVYPNIYWHTRADFNNNEGIAEFPGQPAAFLETCTDSFALKDTPHTFKTVEFFGRSDYCNCNMEEHFFHHTGAETLCRGNLLILTQKKNNIIFVQHAPPSREKRDFEQYDFRIAGNTVFSCTSGIHPHEILSKQFLSGYRHTVICTSEICAERAVKEYMESLTGKADANEQRIVINPWGGGNFPRKVSEKFLKKEITAAGKIGAEAYQIDDGWQNGGLLSDITVHNKKTDISFWDISKKLLKGSFRSICSAAEKAKVRIALWSAPSCNFGYSDWKIFADRMLTFYKTYGITLFKFDGIRIRTKTAEDNLEKLAEYMVRASGGKIRINWDTTNGQRPGYFLFSEYGNIFLENRYVHANWGVGYHPETVLKNFWRLSRYVRAQKIQIEICDPGIINPAFYKKKKMSSRDVYPAEYWAAIALFANPLGWFNPSELSPKTGVNYREFFELHKSIRSELFSGIIYPVGTEPDGGAICGFQSHNSSSRSGFLILFREIKAPNKAKIALRCLDDADYRFISMLHNKDAISVKAGADFPAVFDKPASFLLYRYKKVITSV